MAERDPFRDLDALAAYGEDHATPIPAERVRQLGQRRRNRRYGAIAGLALAIVVAGGGAVYSQTGLNVGRPVNPVATPGVTTAVPSPAPSTRTVTEANLVQLSDLPKTANVSYRIWGENARTPDQVSVCQGPLAELGAQQVVSRSFDRVYPGAPEPTGPMANAPTTYVQALQFADAAEAEKALLTYRNWLVDCDTALQASPTWKAIDSTRKVEWYGVTSGGKKIGEFTQVPLYTGADDASGNGYFETVGLTRVADRLMVTVDIVYGNEKHASYTQGGDDDTGIPEDVQFPLIEAAAKRLAG